VEIQSTALDILIFSGRICLLTIIYLSYLTRDEKLIEVGTGNAIPFKKTGQEFEIYTWS
jgi:hypothetical protein